MSRVVSMVDMLNRQNHRLRCRVRDLEAEVDQLRGEGDPVLDFLRAFSPMPGGSLTARALGRLRALAAGLRPGRGAPRTPASCRR